MPSRKWYVYENLNNPQDRKVLSDAEIVAEHLERRPSWRTL